MTTPALLMTNTLLRTFGNKSIDVRIPLNATSPDEASELGITGTPTDVVTLAPVIVRRDSNKKTDAKRHELLISASTLATAREITTVSDARDFFISALSITVEGVDMRVVSFEADEYNGAAYLYRVVVEE